ncbi:hypothetical protein R3W88_026163 [Solanum pinnatisectum]|uniref:Replication factor A C-terminal domain-containing protein n=1 Tax=Solanum pinnatisectum TaxID=50273 RepID=A0AAV9LCK4_9SOLN|nr:hypothetical protein R3W88_026163 [Solanum pinnatisectum]
MFNLLAQVVNIHKRRFPYASFHLCFVDFVDLCFSTYSIIAFVLFIYVSSHEDQIKGIVYGDDIPCYQDQINLYRTYYIAGTRSNRCSKYEKPLHAFELVFHKKNVLVELEENDVNALPLPTKLTLTSFTDIKQQVLHATTDLNKKEFDILAIVVNCFPRRYLMSMNKWLITENKPTLTSFTLRSSSKSGTLISIPVDEEVILIANGESQEDGQTFSTEAKISFPPDQKKYYVLVCSNCGQDVRYPIIMQIHCMNCGEHRMLIPRCRFNVNLEDSSGTTTAMIMNKEGEKLLSLTAEQIYERTSTKNNFPPMKDLDTAFTNNIFSIRAKKIFTRAPNATATKLYIHSCMEKEYTTHPPTTPNTNNIHEPNKRNQLLEPHQLTEQAKLSSPRMKQTLEPPTPEKPN